MNNDGFWVFGYGSLMWRPGFDVAETRMARLDGYKRAFALVSVHYRGTPERPGLVLGLDWEPDSGCTGMALRIGAGEADEVRHYLAERELVSRAYFEVSHPITLLCPGRDSDRGRATASMRSASSSTAPIRNMPAAWRWRSRRR